MTSFYVDLTLAGVIREKEAAIEKIPPKDLAEGRPVEHFLN